MHCYNVHTALIYKSRFFQKLYARVGLSDTGKGGLLTAPPCQLFPQLRKVVDHYANPPPAVISNPCRTVYLAFGCLNFFKQLTAGHIANLHKSNSSIPFLIQLDLIRISIVSQSSVSNDTSFSMLQISQSK